MWQQFYAADVIPALKKDPTASLKKEARFEVRYVSLPPSLSPSLPPSLPPSLFSQTKVILSSFPPSLPSSP